MEDSDDESYVKHVDTDEQDSDYEFDAPQFFDFTRPEFGSEIEEAERWFEVSGDYPHSREFFFFYLFICLFIFFLVLWSMTWPLYCRLRIYFYLFFNLFFRPVVLCFCLLVLSCNACRKKFCCVFMIKRIRFGWINWTVIKFVHLLKIECEAINKVKFV